MRLVLANHSSYPRVGEGAEAQRVRRGYARRETGELDDAGYLEICRDYAAEIVREQEAAGVELVTDGQVHWYDLVSHLAAQLEGVRIGGLLRFFDTNYLVRQPEIVGELRGGFALRDDHEHTTTVASGEAKAVLTGPYTLARHSILTADSPYPDVPSLTMAYAEIAAAEVAALAEAGARWIQVEEPSIVHSPDDAIVVRQGLERLVANKGAAKVSLVTYFGHTTNLYHELLEMPADMLGFDLTYDRGIAEVLIDQGCDRPVALGAVDGRNTKLDDVEDAARIVDRVMEALATRGVDEVHLQPSCGLEYLPRDRAARKLERMREIGRAVEKVGA